MLFMIINYSGVACTPCYLPTMAFFLTGFPGIRLKFLNMRNITQANTDDDIDRRVLSISKLSDGALSYFANLTGHSSMISILIFLYISKIIINSCLTVLPFLICQARGSAF